MLLRCFSNHRYPSILVPDSYVAVPTPEIWLVLEISCSMPTQHQSMNSYNLNFSNPISWVCDILKFLRKSPFLFNWRKTFQKFIHSGDHQIFVFSELIFSLNIYSMLFVFDISGFVSLYAPSYDVTSFPPLTFSSNS